MRRLLQVPISAGELFDKKTILEIKRARIKDPDRLANVEYEWGLISSICESDVFGFKTNAELQQLISDLALINSELWDLENAVRTHEQAGTFEWTFIEAARNIYKCNDRRARIKWRINQLLHSFIVEEKSHG